MFDIIFYVLIVAAIAFFRLFYWGKGTWLSPFLYTLFFAVILLFDRINTVYSLNVNSIAFYYLLILWAVFVLYFEFRKYINSFIKGSICAIKSLFRN